MRRIALYAAAGMAPDLDLLVGAHSGPSHGVGPALILGMVSWLVVRPRDAVLAAAMTLAYGSHTLLDWLGTDSSPPIGIMALWPFSREYYMAPVPIIEPVSRNFHWEYFWSHNLRVVGLEILIFGTLALAAHRWRGRAQGAGTQ